MHIPYERLNPETLRNLILEIVSREGSDYGEREQSLEEKREQALAGLRRGDIALTFDPETESCNLVPILGKRF